jgi:hypothetical protein
MNLSIRFTSCSITSRKFKERTYPTVGPLYSTTHVLYLTHDLISSSRIPLSLSSNSESLTHLKLDGRETGRRTEKASSNGGMFQDRPEAWQEPRQGGSRLEAPQPELRHQLRRRSCNSGVGGWHQPLLRLPPLLHL